MNAACALSIYIYLFIFMFLFFQNSANNNDDVDNNTNNEDCSCHGIDDSESSSEYESDISGDGSDVQPQPQHRSVRGRGLIRGCGGRFRGCGRIAARGCRDVVPRVANQPVILSDITDFENPNIDKLFRENERPDRLSIIAETLLDCLQMFFSDKAFKMIIEQSNRYHEQQSNSVTDDR